MSDKELLRIIKDKVKYWCCPEAESNILSKDEEKMSESILQALLKEYYLVPKVGLEEKIFDVIEKIKPPVDGEENEEDNRIAHAIAEKFGAVKADYERYVFMQENELYWDTEYFETKKEAEDALDQIENMAHNKTYKERGFTVAKVKLFIEEEK